MLLKNSLMDSRSRSATSALMIPWKLPSAFRARNGKRFSASSCSRASHRVIFRSRASFASFVALDDGARVVEDDLRVSVVLLQADDPGAGIIFLKLQDVLDGGPAPAINRLVFIADHTQVLVIESELADELVLDAVGVLVFVHQDVAKPLVVPLANVRSLVKERDRLEQQVVKVERIRLAQFPLVEVIDRRQLLRLGVGGVAVEFLGADAAVFGVADLGERHARGRNQLGQPQL